MLHTGGDDSAWYECYGTSAEYFQNLFKLWKKLKVEVREASIAYEHLKKNWASEDACTYLGQVRIAV